MRKEIGYNILVADLGTKHQSGTVGIYAYVTATSPRAAVQKAKEREQAIQPFIGKRRYRIYAEAA